MKKILLFSIILAMMLPMLSSCSAAGRTSSSNRISACLGLKPASIDPATLESADAATYVSHLFEGLTKYNKNMKVVAGIAESLPTVSSDGLVYTYKIRSDAKWSDGKSITAQDFVYSWQRAVDPSTASYTAYQLYYIKNAQEINSQFLDSNGKPAKAKVDKKGNFVKDSKGNYIADPNGKYVSANADGTPIWLDDLGVKAIDETTLQVTLTSPCSYFNQITAYPTLFPVRQDAVEKSPDSWATSPTTYLCDGPYLMKSLNSTELVMEKNPYYYGSGSVTADELDFVFMNDNSAALTAYKSGSLDLVQTMIPSAEIPALISSGDCVVYPQLGVDYVSLNHQKKIFQSKDVCKALALAIDRNYIVNTIKKAGQVAAGAFVPFNITDTLTGADFRKTGGNYIDVSKAAYENNVATAKGLLSAAGYPGGKNFPTLEYKYYDAGSNKSVAEYLKSVWKENLGIDIDLVSEEYTTLNSDRESGDFDMLSDSVSADYSDPMYFLDMFVTGNGYNDAYYSNTEYDKLISRAKACTDEKQRLSLLHKAEDLLMGDMAVIPLNYRSDPILADKRVTGYVDSPLGYLYLMWAYIKK